MPVESMWGLNRSHSNQALLRTHSGKRHLTSLKRRKASTLRGDGRVSFLLSSRGAEQRVAHRHRLLLPPVGPHLIPRERKVRDRDREGVCVRASDRGGEGETASARE